MKDKVYAKPVREIKPFTFDENVADVFENMIKRSVPGYELLLELIGVLTQKYSQPNSFCYDLGCSLGASTLQIRRNLPDASCKIIAVDNSEAMVRRCRNVMQRDHSEAAVEVRLEDIQNTKIENACMVTLNFTLQFIAEEQRSDLLKNIANGINEGGILVLSEKIKLDDSRIQESETQEIMTDLHHEFKKLKGYSDLEIAQKRSSLENVLIPDTLHIHFERLKDAGFKKSLLYLQCLNFVSILAIK